MTTEQIIESGMLFGPYPDGYCFHIEKSETFKKIQHGVKMAEFLLLLTSANQIPTIWVIEAKSSAPRPENHTDFNTYINEIKEKLTNAMTLSVATHLNRHILAQAELPEPFKKLDLAITDFRLALIVKDHHDAWMPQLQDALKRALNATVKTWALPPTAVVVINDSKAKQKGLISNTDN